jgi:UDP-4-amino-4,6-dideoxy-N-acetyl-beta-L-altrosamine N-acetyltransferase
VGDDLILAGDRVRLRPLALDDADDVVRWRRDPVVAREMFSPPPVSREQHLRWFAAMQARGDRQEFVILLAAQGDRGVGTIGLSNIDRARHRAEYGILIGEATARGQGVAQEASRLLLDYAFGPLALERVYLQMFADNTAAARLYERLGFVREGVLRGHAVRDGLAEDVVVMGILKQEWARHRRHHER